MRTFLPSFSLGIVGDVLGRLSRGWWIEGIPSLKERLLQSKDEISLFCKNTQVKQEAQKIYISFTINL